MKSYDLLLSLYAPNIITYIKGTGSPYKLKVYYLYHNSGHCTHNPVNWQLSKEITYLYGKNKMAVLLIASWSLYMVTQFL